MGFPCGSADKEFACHAEDLGLIPGLGRSSGEGKGYPLQYSGLEKLMDCIVHEVAKSKTQLSDFHFYFVSHLTQWLPCEVSDVFLSPFLRWGTEVLRDKTVSQDLSALKWRNQDSYLDLWIQSWVAFLLKYPRVTTILPQK